MLPTLCVVVYLFLDTLYTAANLNALVSDEVPALIKAWKVRIANIQGVWGRKCKLNLEDKANLQTYMTLFTERLDSTLEDVCTEPPAHILSFPLTARLIVQIVIAASSCLGILLRDY